MTTIFYVPPEQIIGDRLRLPEEEARHASKVLRAVSGDVVVVVDGEGGWYRVQLDHVDRSVASGHVIERRREVGEMGYDLTLAVGIIKQRARFEVLLEKAAELGVSAVVPLRTDRTEKDHIRHKRLENKLVAAMKQCGRSRMVTLKEPVTFEEYLMEDAPQLALCCHEAAKPEDHLLGMLRTADLPSEIGILVGPEGGFSQSEIERAKERGWRIISLGPRRLRSETAAIAAAAGVSLVYNSI